MMFSLLCYVTFALLYFGRIVWLLGGYRELTFKHDRIEVERVLRGTTGAFLLVTATYLLMPDWRVASALAMAAGLALVLSALGGTEFHSDEACAECGPPLMFTVPTLDHTDAYADAMVGDMVVDRSTYLVYTMTNGGLREVQHS